jgi:DNA (cytosine-5)-methyltransferase 1
MLDLFSGIGGFSYAAEKLVGGYETVAFCEYDKHAQKVLRKHWPDTEIIDDVRELANDADRFRGLVDIVVGGYPCQPFSLAGVRRGDKDDRHLWPEMLKIVQAVRPTWVIGENVTGHISMGIDTVLSDLEAAGYASRCYVIPAVAADAPHRRDRCWIVANAGCQRQGVEVSRSGGQPIDGSATGQRTEARDRFADGGETMADTDNGDSKGVNGWKLEPSEQRGRQGFAARREDVPNPESQRLQRQSEPKGSGQTGRQPVGDEGLSWGKSKFWEPEPAVGRVANGVSGRVHRLRQLGNSIVPQVAARILWAIKEAHNG